MKDKTALDYINDSLIFIDSRLRVNPGFNLYVMAFEQVKYVQELLLGTKKDKTKLHSMNLGVLASKEFDATDPELAHHLSNVNYILSQMAGGLKIILPHEEDVKYKRRMKRYIAK